MPHENPHENACNTALIGCIESASAPLPARQPECGSHSAASPEIKFTHGGRRPGAGRKPKPKHVMTPLRDKRAELGERWYCWKCRPGADLVVIRELIDAGFTVHFPLYVDDPRRGPRPLFPTYGFVAFDVADPRWKVIPYRPGMQRLFSTSADRPTPLPVGYVEALIRSAGLDEVIDLRPPPVPVGEEVRIVSGLFGDVQALVQRSDHERVAVLLNIFGRDVEVELQSSAVERVAG